MVAAARPGLADLCYQGLNVTQQHGLQWAAPLEFPHQNVSSDAERGAGVLHYRMVQ